MSNPADLQAEFDRKYIGSPEALKRLRISRTAFSYGRKRGWMPPPIRIPGSVIRVFIRAEAEPCIALWLERLASNPNAPEHVQRPTPPVAIARSAPAQQSL